MGDCSRRGDVRLQWLRCMIGLGSRIRYTVVLDVLLMTLAKGPVVP